MKASSGSNTRASFSDASSLAPSSFTSTSCLRPAGRARLSSQQNTPPADHTRVGSVAMKHAQQQWGSPLSVHQLALLLELNQRQRLHLLRLLLLDCGARGEATGVLLEPRNTQDTT